jgi:hypothetical protein
MKRRKREDDSRWSSIEDQRNEQTPERVAWRSDKRMSKPTDSKAGQLTALAARDVQKKHKEGLGHGRVWVTQAHPRTPSRFREELEEKYKSVDV